MNKLSHFVYPRLPAGLFSSSQRKRTNTLQHFKFDHFKVAVFINKRIISKCNRAVIKISSRQANDTSRWGIQQLGILQK